MSMSNGNANASPRNSTDSLLHTPEDLQRKFMSHAAAAVGGNADGTIPLRAAQWAVRILQEAAIPAPQLQASIESGTTSFELRILKLPQLKKISNVMLARLTATSDPRNPAGSSFPPYYQPKSGAKKAEWVTAISNYFQQCKNITSRNNNPSMINDIYTLLNENALSTAPLAKVVSSTIKLSATAKTSARKEILKKKSPSPAKARKKAKPRTSKERISQSTSGAVADAADEAMARSLQNKFYQEDMDMGSTSLGGKGFHSSWGGPLTNSSLENSTGSSSMLANNPVVPKGINGKDPRYGLKMPAKSSGNDKPTSRPVKIKIEPLSYAAAAASAADELQPRNVRETNMVANLREMGFENTREILTALRAVAAERDEVSIVSEPYCHTWSTQEQVDAAMMWIVTQREEAAEAAKLDEARMSSEQADRAMEQSRRENMVRQLNAADLVDLIGTSDTRDTNELEIKSKYFPSSILLGNQYVKKVMKMTATHGCITGKAQIVRLLSLEKNARKWYGTVTPFSYFKYVVCPRFESLARELDTLASQTLEKKMSNESDLLEKALFNLSEQEEGGVGSVPKIFLTAQREASESGKPTSADDGRNKLDDDVQVVRLSLGKLGSSTGNTGGLARRSVEIIDIT